MINLNFLHYITLLYILVDIWDVMGSKLLILKMFMICQLRNIRDLIVKIIEEI